MVLESADGTIIESCAAAACVHSMTKAAAVCSCGGVSGGLSEGLTELTTYLFILIQAIEQT